MNIQLYLDKIVTLFKEELKENLLGIYLHGSLATGCFNPQKSDIDFFVIVKEKLTTENIRRISKISLSLHDEMPNKRGIEFSIILEAHLKPFVYPTPIEFHYSDYYREKYRENENYFCGGIVDEDFASQIVVAYYRGIPLYGKSLQDTYEPIDRQFYILSILHDVKDASQNIIDDPMYLTLNLCRVLFFLKEGAISSKKEGGEWGVKNLPREYQGLVQACLDKYIGLVDKNKYNREQLLNYADYMLYEINQLI